MRELAKEAVCWFVILFVLLYVITGCQGEQAQPRAWETGHQSAVAACSPLCRITAKCAGMDLAECESSCVASLCAGVDCDAPPAGTDEQIDACLKGVWTILYSEDACSACVTYSDECAAMIQP